MNQNQNNVPVDDNLNNQQIAEQPLHDKNQEIREYYLRQLWLMCPTISENKPDNIKLVILQKRISRLIKMLSLFDRSYIDEIPVIQKAVLQYIATEGIPQKERQQIIESWGNWAAFLFEISCYRGLLTQFLQYHHRQLHDLEHLLGCDSSETSDLPTD